ncbi:MAG: polysaccharide deacetylase family protein [Lentisphaeria bacterium]|nr:polysaccharide deacetylase family protein [Lentisphaeria bacterium]
MLNNITWLYPQGKSRAVTFSYDDGQIYDREVIKRLNRYGMKGTFNLCTAYASNEANVRHLRLEEFAELYKGHEVAVHCPHHPFLDRCNKGQVLAEVMEDRRILEKLVGYPVTGMAYPFGTWNEMVIDELKAAGIVYSRSVASTGRFNLPQKWLEWSPSCHHSGAMALMDNFKACRYPLSLFYIWGHSYEFNDNNNWNLLDEICEALPKDDETWYATNGEIHAYIEAMRSLVLTADLSRVYNPTATEIWFDLNGGRKLSVKPGELLEI